MIPEIGHFALILALATSIVLSIVPLTGSLINYPSWQRVARPAAVAQFVFLLISFLCLTYAFVVSDFSVKYVASNSNTALPTIYKVSAVWGAHEGSLLLWALTLSIWTAAVGVFSKSIPQEVIARVLSVMGIISIGFILFMLLTSNPFDRLLSPPLDGRDLNPLLQDFGLIIHPPMLYMGYVGFAVAFAFAIAAMIGGQLDAAWAKWSRPWTNVAWFFLTVGITLGSWWAYYELGWGGWWFWDPVENASFMPWLVGTALMHSLAVTEKRGTFKAWTVLLAIFAFSLSLLGTFLVRSGVLTSVHAFASDPARGVFILIFLVLVIGSSLILYTWRASQIKSSTSFGLVSKETGLLFNNVILVVAAASILLGTLYPLVLDALGVGKVSVGPPYFNSVFIPLMAPLVVLMGFGALTRWKNDKLSVLWGKVRLSAAMSIVFGGLSPLLMAKGWDWQAAAGMTLVFWVVLTTGVWLKAYLRNKGSTLAGLKKMPLGSYGMMTGHIGIAIFVTGLSLTAIYSEEKDLKMAFGDTYSMDEYTFVFRGVEKTEGPNYKAFKGMIDVSSGTTSLGTMEPEKRIYNVQKMPMTEAAIDAGLTRDLFIALGEDLGDGSWTLRIYYKPFVRWLWIGGLVMGLGGLLAAMDKRYYRRRKQVA
jgi:cytochrome c-type biogenesis protein CcmF